MNRPTPRPTTARPRRVQTFGDALALLDWLAYDWQYCRQYLGAGLIEEAAQTYAEQLAATAESYGMTAQKLEALRLSR